MHTESGAKIKKIRIALVGAGYWGKNLARNLHELSVLAGVCDAKGQSAQVLAAQYNVPTLKLEQILSDSHLDGVMIAAPASLHHQLAKQALESGKHVFVEKPLTLRLEDAIELNMLAKKLHKKLMVGHLLQYHPVFSKLKTLIKDGALGIIKYVYSHRLDFGKFYSEEDVIWNLAPHDVSMILSIMDAEPASVHIVPGACDEKGLAHSAVLHMNFSQDRKAHVFVSRLKPFKEHKLTVIGSKMLAVFDDTQDWNKKLCLTAYRLENDGTAIKDTPQFVAVEKSEPLHNECEHFMQCIAHNTVPLTDGEEAVRVLRVLAH